MAITAPFISPPAMQAQSDPSQVGIVVLPPDPAPTPPDVATAGASDMYVALAVVAVIAYFFFME